jgi:hypothetical protein
MARRLEADQTRILRQIAEDDAALSFLHKSEHLSAA